MILSSYTRQRALFALMCAVWGTNWLALKAGTMAVPAGLLLRHAMDRGRADPAGIRLGTRPAPVDRSPAGAADADRGVPDGRLQRGRADVWAALR